MSGKKSAGVDTARSLALLWGSYTKPGRSGLTISSIVRAAIEIADVEGLVSVSMRRVAERLEVGTMSIYTHVPGKGELVALMIDSTYRELYEQPGAARTRLPRDWRQGLEFVATRNWELVQQHPWLLDAVGGRPLLGPNASLKYESELVPLDGIGLSDVEMDSVLTLVLTHVEGVARIAARQVQVQRETGMSDAEWWVSNAPLLSQVMDPTRFPVSSRVGESAGKEHQAPNSPDYLLSFGLAVILTGVENLIAQRSSRPEPR